MSNCPLCHLDHVVKNSHIHNGKQRFKCCDCGRKFIENSTKITISQQTKSLIDQPKAAALSDRLLLERISGSAKQVMMSCGDEQNTLRYDCKKFATDAEISTKRTILI